MNYRHAFHAGNFADVVKHAILARILVYLGQKSAPFRFIDTHAGAGRYDLMGAEAQRSPEWRDGVARLHRGLAPRRRSRRCSRPICEAIGPLGAGRRPASYPGSPAIAQALLRGEDRLALCEAHPEEREKLIAALGRDRRLNIVGTDGYVALNAYLPPKERRGLVLIDPPFEAPDELDRVEGALARALRKWPAGVYLMWRPIREAARRRAFPQQCRRPRRAEHFADRDRRRGRPGRRARSAPALERGPPDRQPAAFVVRRSEGADAVAFDAARARRPRRLCLPMAHAAALVATAWLTWTSPQAWSAWRLNRRLPFVLEQKVYKGRNRW